MTSFDPPAPGTANSVPGATSDADSRANAIITLTNMLNAMMHLSGGSQPAPQVSQDNDSPAAVPAPAAVVPPAAAAPPAVVAAPTATVPAVVAPLALRTSGPWTADAFYIVVPLQPLQAVAEPQYADNDDIPHWYGITTGRYVGVTRSNPLALAATVGVRGGAMRKYKTQVAALQAFNDCLTLGSVAIVP
ncbi:hypothetical protein R3P38DRAFT_3177830 [Favolaschia claudopus]|uniref:Uncharacterized protein n=1 Tax=Favolaschia claudopus TaxID=2862362 RepID=A0AAW0CUC3_9AGAR